jgi:predicted amidohydrolase
MTARDDDRQAPARLSRRSLLAAAGLASGAAGLLAGGSEAEALQRGGPPLQMQTDGLYPTAPLTKDGVSLGVVQSRVRAVEVGRLRQTRQDNLAHMLDLIDNAQGWGGRSDILFFHEFPITGWSGAWDRRDALRVAIDIPGEETEAIAAKAREYGCMIVFGSYARDPDWPDHLLSITTVMGPTGAILDRHWKARNIKGVFQGFELFTTTIHDVLERYVEMYGRDAVIPVTRTGFGNIATSSVQREPELFRAFAMKGAEIILRTASGGFTPADIQATSMYNSVYTAVSNNAVSPHNPGFMEGVGMVGGSSIYGPRGELLDEASSEHETLVSARIPIADFRARHRQPIVHMSLYRDVFEAYAERYPPNLFAEYLPTDGQDAARFLRDRSSWR